MSPCLFNLYAEYIIQNARLDKIQASSSLLGEISITSDMQMTPPLWQRVKKKKSLFHKDKETEEELQSLLMKVKEEREKVG